MFQNDQVQLQKVVASKEPESVHLFFVPQFTHWPPAPPSRQRSLMDIFGDTGNAGRIRKTIHFYAMLKASVRIGNPINLYEVIQEHPEWTDERIARHLGRLMLVQLGRGSMTIHGPPMKSPEQLRHEILDRRSFKRDLEEYMKVSGESLEVSRSKANRYYAKSLLNLPMSFKC